MFRYSNKNKRGLTTPLPRRATAASAGYDFFSPEKVECVPGVVYSMKLGVSWEPITENPVVLLVMPRSSLGMKYGFKLTNTIGVIDADYVCGDTDGEICISWTVEKPLTVEAGDRIVQGVVVGFLTNDDYEEVDTVRTGGVGSTGK